mmetsp:Transcript_8728/g.21519  ORF Transcript_8728/g.21519 Transcript_8728/m.21519 type:complete len:179 (-) Transcript_8728:216-752(-)
MFVFPVMYTHSDTEEPKLCSYVPVLYLNSSIGVAGGLYYGLRKEYHPGMKVIETSKSKEWHIKNIIDASFIQKKALVPAAQLPPFIVQSFANPFVTISYPMPITTTKFYQAKVYPVGNVMSCSQTFEWHYKNGSDIKSNSETWSVFSSYWFSMSKPMSYDQYFKSGSSFKSGSAPFKT